MRPGRHLHAAVHVRRELKAMRDRRRRRPGIHAALAAAWLVAAGCREAARPPAAVRSLTTVLATAELCRAGDCVRGRPAAEARGGGVLDDAAILSLPVGSDSNLYLRIAAGSRLSFEYRAVGARLRMSETPAGGSPQVLRSGLAADDWTRATVDLAGVDGIVGIALTAEDVAGGFVLVRSLRLEEPRPVPAPVPDRPVGRRPNVLVYVIDTLRADRLGCFGGSRGLTPNLDAFAREAIRFPDMVAQSSWTRPSTASILTGLLPQRHGAIGPPDAIDPNVPMLAERLRAAGHRTAAWVVNPVVADDFGFGRGFEHFRLFEDSPALPERFVSASSVVPHVLRWIRVTPEPFFAYVHTADPHDPYAPPRALRDRFAHAVGDVAPATILRQQRDCPTCLQETHRDARPVPIRPEAVAVMESLYDGDVAAADAAFGRLVEGLRRLGRLDDTLVIVTSDHGEEFLEHGGLVHHQTLYDEVLHVPLLVRLPGGARGGTEDRRLSTHVDIVPTILETVGLDGRGLDGVSLLGPVTDRTEVTSHVLRWQGGEAVAVRDRRFAFIHLVGTPPDAVEVYDHGTDPREQDDLAARDPVLRGYATERLAHTLPPQRTRVVVRADAVERLRALGYLSE